MNPSIRSLVSEYRKKSSLIKKRLEEFGSLRLARGKDIFEELCFCILTPQAKAIHCDAALKELKKGRLLYRAGAKRISLKLKGRVRFHNKKAEYLILARKKFYCGNSKEGIDIKRKIGTDKNTEIREWLVKNIKGLGYKEASHFLRNIGCGKGLAILDVHILKNLKNYGVIRKTPVSLNKKAYLEIENKMKKFSGKAGIPLEALDLVLWSKETGYVFK
ncbi:MAG: N-glycosylase/DNA lyase [Candidatus Omnitrophica bacterium]|nr:N-glycosylase/DNA lyase [Candidatus Omnitrophota bacterium]